MNNDPKASVRISVVLPARNEAEGIAKVIQAARPYCDEIIVIDGHSSDQTAAIARDTGVVVWQDNGRGKGAAYMLGIEKASGDVVVFMDADGSHIAEDIPRLVAPIADGRADLVIASRHKGGSDEWEGNLDTWLRSIGSGFLSVIINRRWGTGITDCLNGFRAIRREVALKVPFRAYDFDIEQHMVVQVARYGYKVAEVGSHEYCRGWGVSKLPTFRKAYLFFWRLFLDMLPQR